MRHLGSISGKGRLVVGEDINVDAEYKIDVWAESSYMKTANGTILAELHALWTAKEVGFTLELSDGSKVEGTVNTISNGKAGIHINTPIPGF